MRISPSGARYVYVAGKGAHPPAPMVTVCLEDTTSIALAPGHHACWEHEHAVAWSPQEDGMVQDASEGTWAVHQTSILAGNVLAAAGGHLAASRTDPRRVFLSNGRVIFGATDPVLSDDGVWLAYFLPDQPSPGVMSITVERFDGTAPQRIVFTGAPNKARFGGTTLVWECGAGVVAGIADVANPTSPVGRFNLPAWKLYEPVPVWVAARGELFLLALSDEGSRAEIICAEWGSLVAGNPFGYHLGYSTGSGYEHDVKPVRDSGILHVRWLDPAGVPAGGALDLIAMRSTLQPPKPQAPDVLPDIAWKADPTRTVDLLDYVKAAATAIKDNGNGTGELWLHKSQERPNWGENWCWDKDYIGFVEDRSTGTRMVSQVRPFDPGNPHKNLTRNRLSPEDILRLNAAGANLGDPLTLPLAGYTWRGNHVWMIRHVTGHATIDQRTDYVWWDLPEFGGVWETWANLPLTIEVVTGYARLNGHDVYALTRYGKPDGNEWNAWGPHGWIAFMAFNADGSEEVAARRVAPPEQRASTYSEPFVPARFPAVFPIYVAPPPPPPPKPTMPDSATTAQIADYIGQLDDPILLGARQRYRDEVLLPRDRVASAVDGTGNPANATDMMTGGAAMFFDRGYVRDYLIARIKGAAVIDASVAGLIGAANDYRKAVGITPTEPDLPTGAIHGRLRVEAGRLRDDAGWVNYQGMSAFSLIGHAMQGRRSEAVRQIRRSARAGRNALRVFCMLDPLDGGFGPVSRFTPDMPGWREAVDIIIGEAAPIGLRLQLNIFADAQRLYPDHQDRRRVLRAVATLYKDVPAVWFRLANEARQNGWSEGDDPQLLELADELADILGHRDYGISDVLDDGSESGSSQQRDRIGRIAQHCNVGLSHPDRAEPEPRRVRTVEHIEAIWETFQAVAPHQAVIIDEHRGFASQFIAGRRDNRSAVAVADACTCSVLGMGYTYHHIAEQDDATPGLDEARIALTIPVSPDFHYRNANLGGSWIGPVPPWDKIRPCHNGAVGYAAAIGDQQGPIAAQSGWVVESSRVFESAQDDPNLHVYFSLATGRHV